MNNTYTQRGNALSYFSIERGLDFMGVVVPMLGNTYGELIVIQEFSDTDKKKCVCKCSCGKVVEKSRRDVKSGNTSSCGCLKKRLAQERYTKDLTGQRFGKLLVKELIKDYEFATSDGAYWLCLCDCGKEKVIHRNGLLNGNTSSCGCLRGQFQRDPRNGLAEDLVGNRYGEWTVLENFALETGRLCVAQCSCGNIERVPRSNLVSGKTKGCHKCKGKRLKEERKYKNVGLTQGRLTIIDVDDNYKYVCRCKCGSTKTISKSSWNQGVQSCGCYKVDNARRLYTDDLTDKVFGKITVLQPIFRDGQPPKWLCICECGEEFETNGITLKTGSGMCKKCWAKHNSGENNPSWNPNLTDEDRENRRVYQGNSQELWRKQVFERDDYTCQCCGKRGGKLNAHHLDGYNWCKERRFDIDNGVTLCRECHRQFHKLYGCKNNTKEQFDEYIESLNISTSE